MNGNAARLCLDLIDDKLAALRQARRLAQAQLGCAHPDVGKLELQIRLVENARREVADENLRAA